MYTYVYLPSYVIILGGREGVGGVLMQPLSAAITTSQLSRLRRKYAELSRLSVVQKQRKNQSTDRSRRRFCIVVARGGREQQCESSRPQSLEMNPIINKKDVLSQGIRAMPL